jgi:hypothetical protein
MLRGWRRIVKVSGSWLPVERLGLIEGRSKSHREIVMAIN